ncbi:pentatricopeptide repeat-containing protein At4g15720-like [Aristolochia californica]|uniref:pentatricopeptide repeat-containing protein At4g15720-like n=1 Tax=Aristolochia californica TaxID=171875 RepID=UPI0035D999AC
MRIIGGQRKSSWLGISFLSLQHRRPKTHLPPTTDLVQQLQNVQNHCRVISVHCKLFKFGLSGDIFINNHLLNGYLKFRRIDDARRVFDEIPEPNVVSFTSLMAGFVDHQQAREALFLFNRMSANGTMPNEFTFATAVNACSVLADLEAGRKIHALVQTFGFRQNLVITSSLVDMYGKSNNTDDARRVFDEMVERNIISWSSMISAYAQNARGHEALELFRDLLNEYSLELLPNQFTYASVLNACASLGSLAAGRASHAAIIRRLHHMNEVVASALVDMYAKCGLIRYSCVVFRRMENPSVIPYTSMIVGAAKHGLGRFSLDLFEEMTDRGVRPNDVTFIGVLHACSHSGLVDFGLDHLNSMCERYNVVPDARHYTCVVDMLGRAGRLDEAYQLASDIPVGDGNDIALLWGSLLSASRTHGRLDLVIEAGNRLIESNQQVTAAYITMSNTYALVGNWDYVHGLRTEMKKRGLQKEPGCSWVEVKSTIYVFYAGDASKCPRGAEVMNALKVLELRMRERGYVGGKGGHGLVFVDVEEEAKEVILGLHSERLALGFALISMAKGVTIRVMKNLRMCGDCHAAFKLISDIVRRDLVVRDVNRFHHFRCGSCSCGDYW